MNYFTPVAPLLAALTLFVAAPKADAAQIQRGNIAGFGGVTAVNRATVDTLTVPFPTHDGVVDVNCSTGDYQWNGMKQGSALAIVRAWCN